MKRAAILLCVVLSGCVSKKELLATVWNNNAPIPAEICEREPELKKYGFYRRLNDGKFEFVSWCDPISVHWLAAFDKDLEKILGETLPKDPNSSHRLNTLEEIEALSFQADSPELQTPDESR